MIETQPKWYRLEGHEPVLCSYEEYLGWCAANEWEMTHRVALTEADGFRVSTVFLGLDHACLRAEPELFETMVFGNDGEEYQERYATWNEAVAGHERLVAALKGRQP